MASRVLFLQEHQVKNVKQRLKHGLKEKLRELMMKKSPAFKAAFGKQWAKRLTMLIHPETATFMEAPTELCGPTSSLITLKGGPVVGKPHGIVLPRTSRHSLLYSPFSLYSPG